MSQKLPNLISSIQGKCLGRVLSVEEAKQVQKKIDSFGNWQRKEDKEVTALALVDLEKKMYSGQEQRFLVRVRGGLNHLTVLGSHTIHTHEDILLGLFGQFGPCKLGNFRVINGFEVNICYHSSEDRNRALHGAHLARLPMPTGQAGPPLEPLAVNILEE